MPSIASPSNSNSKLIANLRGTKIHVFSPPLNIEVSISTALWFLTTKLLLTRHLYTHGKLLTWSNHISQLLPTSTNPKPTWLPSTARWPVIELKLLISSVVQSIHQDPRTWLRQGKQNMYHHSQMWVVFDWRPQEMPTFSY